MNLNIIKRLNRPYIDKVTNRTEIVLIGYRKTKKIEKSNRIKSEKIPITEERKRAIWEQVQALSPT